MIAAGLFCFFRREFRVRPRQRLPHPLVSPPGPVGRATYMLR